MSFDKPWKRQQRPYAAGGDAGAPNPFWPDASQFDKESFKSRLKHGWWTLGPIGLVAMILGFIFFWPIGLAILFYNIFARKGWSLPMTNPPGSHFWSRPTTGNSAFESWRQTEIERIERERQKLADAEREFSTFLDELKRVKDREEFERFMQARKGWEAPQNPPRAEPAV